VALWGPPDRMHAVPKYLRDHAEPEIRLAEDLDATYERALVVPLFREDPSSVEGFAGAARTSRGRTLAVVVVNAPVDAPPDAHADNRRLMEGLIGRLKDVRRLETSPAAYWGALDPVCDLLVIDRASEGARLPAKQGVGLARKVGTDVAVALHVAGKVRSGLIFGTDADAALPKAHFDAVDFDEESDVAAVVFPFWHEPAGDSALTRATAIYELSLRYYVAGLAWAGSPYAFHTLGSATAVSAAAYAAVRGHPKREAAEDFYLLNKLAKVAKVERSSAAAVRIQSRRSDRTPFGTGRRVAETIASGERDFYSPEVFDALRSLLTVFDSFSVHGSAERARTDVGALPPEIRQVVLSFFEDFDAMSELQAASREVRTPDARRRRVHSWFDAFRTLKFIHAVRDQCHPSVPWHAALAGAPFFEAALAAAPLADACALADDPAFVPERTALARAEANLPRYAGPTA
jgi:hypothetical protein